MIDVMRLAIDVNTQYIGSVGESYFLETSSPPHSSERRKSKSAFANHVEDVWAGEALFWHDGSMAHVLGHGRVRD
jgi:hypothetical protein